MKIDIGTNRPQRIPEGEDRLPPRSWRRICLAFAFVACAHPAHAFKVDIHAHAQVSASNANIADLVAVMDHEDIGYTILMPTPASAINGSTSNSADLIAAVAAAGYSNRFRFMYGGVELNYLLHAAGRLESVPSAYRWDATGSEYSVYPSGCMASDCTAVEPDLATMRDTIEAEITAASTTNFYYNQFLDLANAAAASHNYVGFGEIGAHHYAQYAGHPYIHFPANHAWMKALSDIAAANNMFIDLHMELDADGTSNAQLEDLLAHNSSTKIILEHAGWSTYGVATAEVLTTLMAANTNLYLALKQCHRDEGASACYVEYFEGDSGHITSQVKDAWVTLITTYPDRIMIGSDAKYWQDSSTAQATLNAAVRDVHPNDRLGNIRQLLIYFQLNNPPVATAIGGGTAAALFSLSAP